MARDWCVLGIKSDERKTVAFGKGESGRAIPPIEKEVFEISEAMVEWIRL
jgi:hypothetical protein